MATKEAISPLGGEGRADKQGIAPQCAGGKCHWLQTTSGLLALQMGWGLWLFVAIFADLGWYPAAGTLTCLALSTMYSGAIFSRLFAYCPGAVIFGDVGYFAAGRWGRRVVYGVFYTLNASRGVILHLACTQSLVHVFKADSTPPLWQCGLAIAVVAGLLVQIRSLARLSSLFILGTTCQLAVFIFVVYDLIMYPDPDAHTVSNNVTPGNYKWAFIAVMNVVFAYGGQFAFCEIMASMQKPQQFPWAVSLCTIIMTVLYAFLGAVGYWSRGDEIEGVIIFALPDGVIAQVASAFILVQAVSQYLVNLNVWTHNLLVLAARANRKLHHTRKLAEIDHEQPLLLRAEDDEPLPACSSDHPWQSWMIVSLFVVVYSYLISISVPYFSLLVGMITGATYLTAAYTIPAWFLLLVGGSRIHWAERGFLWLLIPVSILVSAGGFWSSLSQLIEKLTEDGVGSGWQQDPEQPSLGEAVLSVTGLASIMA